MTNDSDNNGGNTGDNNNNNNSGPSGNVFTFGNLDVLGQWDFDQNRGQINNFSGPRKRDININIAHSYKFGIIKSFLISIDKYNKFIR